MNWRDKLSVSTNACLALYTVEEKEDFLKKTTHQERGCAVHALFLILFPAAPTTEFFWTQATEGKTYQTQDGSPW